MGTYKGNFLIFLWHFLRYGKVLYLIVGMSLLQNLFVVIEGVKCSVFQTVPLLLFLRCFQYQQQVFPKVDGTSLFALGSINLIAFPACIVARCALYREGTLCQIYVCPCKPTGFTNADSGVIGYLAAVLFKRSISCKYCLWVMVARMFFSAPSEKISAGCLELRY